jgi:hypothetical protein
MVLCAAALVLWPAAADAQPTAVAHWSFDTDTLTLEGGNIAAAADSAGNHDASVLATGVGAAGPSTPFLASDSVAGPFGQGLRFNGDNYMVFDNLTELMQSAGAPSYTVSLWINWQNAAPPGGPTPFQTFSTWGNGPNGTPNDTARYSYAFGANGASAIRGQTRHESASQAGTDIYARTTTVPSPVNDGAWHMMTWTFDTTLGALNVYYDGAHVEMFQSGAASFQMADNTSPYGSFGLKGDEGNIANRFLPANTHLDEVWVFDSVLTAEEVEVLFNQNGFGPPPVPGDVNGDGFVTLDDFQPIQDNFRMMVASRTDGDLVRNGVVDFHDFREWKTAFLAGGGSLADIDFGFLSSVPEPSAGMLVLLGGCAVAGRRELRERRFAA